MSFIRKTVRGFQIDLLQGEYVDDILLADPDAYDAQELAYLSEHLKAGDVFLDLGAYIGLYSLVAGSAVGPDGRVVAVEADPVNFRRLCGNLQHNKATNVIPVCIGVSDAEETLRLNLNIYGNRGKNSFLMPYPEGLEVGCKPLQGLLNELNITEVAGVKMDIEGFEWRQPLADKKNASTERKRLVIIFSSVKFQNPRQERCFVPGFVTGNLNIKEGQKQGRWYDVV